MKVNKVSVCIVKMEMYFENGNVSSIVNDDIGKVLYLSQKNLTSIKKKKVHKQIKTKTVLNAHKTSKKKKVACLVQTAQNAHKQIKCP